MDSRVTESSSSLWETVATLRAAQYPDLPEDLVREILNIEHVCMDDDATALKRLRTLIEGHLEG